MAGKQLKPLFGWRSAIAESDLPSTTRHVALTLSLWMNQMGGSAFPGAETLAKATGLNVSTVREKLSKLEELGWITCVERGGIKGEKKRANAYEATIPNAQDTSEPDPSDSPTHRSKTPDPSSSQFRPVGEDDPISSLDLFNNSPEAEKPKKKRKPDLLWDALIDSFNIDSELLTRDARRKLQGVHKQLREVGATPEQIPAGVHAYRRQYPKWELTPNSLASHWHELNIRVRIQQIEVCSAGGECEGSGSIPRKNPNTLIREYVSCPDCRPKEQAI